MPPIVHLASSESYELFRIGFAGIVLLLLWSVASEVVPCSPTPPQVPMPFPVQ